ncbi:MAG TPA: class I mannose-6-phosphate isomerase [Brevefilum sp.]|nr:class I mannose-6-phosphate isomerase [Brevefilum sp.]HOR18371.1 class I mannose-6-phosphate isomerase [Brevefilum sp.]
MPELYPLFFEPVLKHYLWGGRNLEKIGRVLPVNQKVAESWDISSHTDGMTTVRNGQFAGKKLPDLLHLLGNSLVGSRNMWAVERGIFPLMVKLLDAEERLSIQVHPDDAYAQKHEGQNELGKAEMWVILNAKPGAAIIYGFSEEINPEKFREAIKTGSVESYLNVLPVKTGDHICVSPGTLHAILEGVLLAEIQQNSNITYRVYDWGRIDDQENVRTLHIDKALDVINFQQVNEPLSLPKVIEKDPHYLLETLCHNPYFTVERFSFGQTSEYSGRCNGSTMEIWGVIQGCAVINGEMMDTVTFCLLPACLGEFCFQVKPGTQMLRVYTG